MTPLKLLAKGELVLLVHPECKRDFRFAKASNLSGVLKPIKLPFNFLSSTFSEDEDVEANWDGVMS